ncbi:MAG: hypothetical protein LBI81_03345 [Puniceicoccales bacterium]|nr:hypothetical protein [Puniceicoccales bacterium]
MDNFVNPISEVVKSKDVEVLEHLLDFFEHRFDYDIEGVCESLKARIEANFTLDQLLEAFYRKFDTLAENDLSMCAELSMWCLWRGKFEEFRKMLNTVKPTKTLELLDKMEDWDKEHKVNIDILREDMKSW